MRHTLGAVNNKRMPISFTAGDPCATQHIVIISLRSIALWEIFKCIQASNLTPFSYRAPTGLRTYPWVKSPGAVSPKMPCPKIPQDALPQDTLRCPAPRCPKMPQHVLRCPNMSFLNKKNNRQKTKLLHNIRYHVYNMGFLGKIVYVF